MIDIEAAFVEHFSYVYLYIRKLSHNEAIAEEITSETFFKALSAIDSFREDCDIRVWLCQIAKNCYFTHVKKLQREQPLESPDVAVPDSLLNAPMEAMLSKETVMEIQRSLHGLDEPYKEVFMWRTLGELSFKQIGALFGKTENWACVTYHRARKKIQEGMEGFNNEKNAALSKTSCHSTWRTWCPRILRVL